jgi:hypothetical protein
MTTEQAFYLLKHFTEVDQITIGKLIDVGYSTSDINKQLELVGSKFFSSFCQSPCDLEARISTGRLIHRIEQSNGRIARVYEFDEIIGTEQIINITSIDSSSIFTLERNGMNIQSISLKELPTTNKLVTVSSETEKWITAFPGNYAPAFPSTWMSIEEHGYATEFWENHVFVV